MYDSQAVVDAHAEAAIDAAIADSQSQWTTDRDRELELRFEPRLTDEGWVDVCRECQQICDGDEDTIRHLTECVGLCETGESKSVNP